MNSLPPAPPENAFTLTPAQQMRLGLLPPDSVVVGAAECSPVVRTSTGRLHVIAADGAVERAGARIRARMEQRVIDFVLPRVR